MKFQKPHKRLITSHDLYLFNQSETYFKIKKFVTDLSNAVQGCPNSTPCEQSDTIRYMLNTLSRIKKITCENPSEKNQQSRFGNPAFRNFYDAVKEYLGELHREFSITNEAVEEVGAYLLESFGDRQRIDYGSGHELSFICWIYCFVLLGKLTRDDYKTVVLQVFVEYMSLMRKLQSTYWQEPAGSHGVWGLDDYHFLPFLFGASQLCQHKYLTPRSIHDDEIVDMFAHDYMYYSCIQFINEVKTASLRWHSPMLDDISSAKSWEKVRVGMLKMYDAEVLSKLPIMQHFQFGSLLKAPEGCSTPRENEEEMLHHHTYGDCCGIPIPSAIAAKEDQLRSQNFRRIPFD